MGTKKFQAHLDAVARSMRDLAILWGKPPPDPENDNAAVGSGEVGKTGHTGHAENTPPRDAVQGGKS